MIINKTKNAVNNLAVGILMKIFQIVLPFTFRTIMVYTIGAQYLGLNSLFTSVLQILNLAELGVGSAMVFSMYKPIAEDDNATINGLMKLYLVYYRIIGFVILAIGILCVPFIPKLISGDIPEGINIYYIYLLNLLATVFTYWLFAYKNSILQAHQRQDIINIVTIITDTIKFILQFIALVVFKNYYLYVISVLLTQVMANIFTAIMSNRLFPQFQPEGTLPENEVKKINKRIIDLFTSKLGGTIVSSADTIVVSAFLGLQILAIYQNYYYIISSILGFIMILNNSVVAGIGNSLLTKSLEDNYSEFEVFSFLQFWIMIFCVSSFSVLLQPFMVLWMGEDLLFDYSVVVLFCIYFIGFQMEKLYSVYIGASGVWHSDRFRPLIYGIANLGLNIFLVQYIGVYGILLSTILTVFLISIPWILKNIFTLVFRRSIKKYLLKLGLYLIEMVVVVVVTNCISALISGTGVKAFFIKCIICLVVPNLLVILLGHKTNEFKKIVKIIKRIVLANF